MNGNKWVNSLMQIALILLASLIVVGATWQVGQSAGAQPAFERGDFDRERPEGERGELGGRGDDHHSADLSLRGIAEFGETIMKMVVVITAIVLGQRAWAWFQMKRTTTKG